jgi:hypothetical protein
MIPVSDQYKLFLTFKDHKSMIQALPDLSQAPQTQLLGDRPKPNTSAMSRKLVVTS